MTTATLRNLLDQRANGTISDADRQTLRAEMDRRNRIEREWSDATLDREDDILPPPQSLAALFKRCGLD